MSRGFPYPGKRQSVDDRAYAFVVAVVESGFQALPLCK